MEWILFGVVVLGIILIALPLIKVFKGQVSALSAKKRILVHIGMFFTFVIALGIATPSISLLKFQSQVDIAESGLFARCSIWLYCCHLNWYGCTWSWYCGCCCCTAAIGGFLKIQRTW